MGALSGIRVIDFTRVVAGPYCTMLLGDLGAEVIKIEQPGRGDDSRGWGPPFEAGESTYFLAVNRNKQSVCLDLQSAAGVAQARALIARGDIVIENFRAGFMDRLGLGYEDLRAAHPRLIYCAITGYGQTGPYRERAGYDVIVSAQGGLMGITGTPGGPPVKTGVATLDLSTGLYAFSAILAALYHRERSGQGQRLDVSLLSTQLATLLNAASGYLVAGELPGPEGSAHPSIVPYQAFRAADGYIVIGAGNDKLFAQLCVALGHPEWAADPRFATNADRVARRDVLVPAIEAVLRTDTVTAWEQRLAATQVAVAPVNDMAQVFADPQVAHSRQVVTVDHPAAGEIKLVGPAVTYSLTPAEVRSAPPLLGEHTAAVLGTLPDDAPATPDAGAGGDSAS
ncbi:MAG TPA: CoA transferase [Ktedonobacterales bacterium]|nr:CoA transferase [Ktedonobacterales bacterium]